MKTPILFSLLLLSSIQLAFSDSWPEWKMSYYGEGWKTQAVADPELIQITENQNHNVGVFVSGKRFHGNIEDLLQKLKSTPGIPDGDKYTLINVNGSKAIQLFTSMNRDGETFKVWGLMFLKNDSIIAIQGIFKDEIGQKFLQRTMLSFKFTENTNP